MTIILRTILIFMFGLVSALLSTYSLAQSKTFQLTLSEARMKVQLSGQNDVIDFGTRKLPWKWDSEFPRKSGIGHFNFIFDLNDANYHTIQVNGQGIAFSALSIGNRYRYRLNSGSWQNIGWDETNTQYRSLPRWHVLQQTQLMQGMNTLELELRFEPANQAGISKIEIGEINSTFVDHQKIINIHYSSSLLMLLISLFIGVFTLVIWSITKRNIFALSAAAEIIFALRQLSVFIEYPPIPTWLWNSFTASSLAVYVWLMCEVSSCLLTSKSPILLSTTRYFTWFSIVVIFIESARGGTHLFLFWLSIIFVLVALHMIRLLWFACRTSDINLRIFALAFMGVVIFGLHDYLYAHFGSTKFGHLRASMFSPLLFNLSLAMIAIRYFLVIQNESNRSKLNADLQNEQAKHGERQRIMTELHDSVGSHLVGLLSLIKGGAARKDIESLTTDALQELRIAVDALQPVNGNLAAVLATLRHRLQPRLDAANLKLIWHVEDLPKLNNLTPQGIQNIQRILLEAFTNIMRHAKASAITVKAVHLASQGIINISICDDGVGFHSSNFEYAGQGIKNMRTRAQAIGTEIEFYTNVPCGSCIRMQIPCSIAI